ncbi:MULTISPECIES: hypothetical protein [Paraburkholderia]|uniref:hypothetical protein n=1 Tax=Paraburkholderia TaxID=1822464 RepID=UPI0009410CFE|nr:hypothetical protein [Paraburkholderia phenazinium]
MKSEDNLLDAAERAKQQVRFRWKAIQVDHIGNAHVSRRDNVQGSVEDVFRIAVRGRCLWLCYARAVVGQLFRKVPKIGLESCTVGGHSVIHD